MRRFRRTIAVGVGVLVLCLAASGAVASPRSDRTTAGPGQEPWRPPIDGAQFYFALTDRFADSDPSNNTGGYRAGESGYDPQDAQYYHGGDLAGLEDGLDYIAGLGSDAIWITPPMTNKPLMKVYGSVEMAAYHGYWTLDLTSIDPHLGGDQAMRSFIDAAHRRGIKVYFDIEINTTADIIGYADQDVSYVPVTEEPWRDADGQPIDIAERAGKPFPDLDPSVSFPHQPVIAPEEQHAKSPDWLNDPTLYHNRGNSTFEGESVTYGDFAGLDDLMTEHPRVVRGMIDVYTDWIDFGVDGFRIDTVKHVNFEFWQEWSRAIMDYAHAHGRDDFFMFAEVLEFEQATLAPYVRDTEIGGVLDFPFAGTVTDFVKGGDPAALGKFFAEDDRYLTPDSSAYGLQTFVSNHDLGRIGQQVAGLDGSAGRARLASDVLLLTRGIPIVYYGDEQGFTGGGQDGNGNDLAADVAARQDMFGSQVPGYQQQKLINGEPLGTRAHFDTSAELYRRISRLADLRQRHPALASGAQLTLPVDRPQHGAAIARIDREQQREYVVAFNNAAQPRTLRVQALSHGSDFDVLLGDPGSAEANPDGTLSVTVPAFGSTVVRAEDTLPAPRIPAAPTVTAEPDGSDQLEVSAEIDQDHWYRTAFSWRSACSGGWRPLGVHDRLHPRVFHDVSALAPGTTIEYQAMTTDVAGRHRVAVTEAVVPGGDGAATTRCGIDSSRRSDG